MLDRLNLAVRCARAIATNQLARIAPALYIRLTGQTGRGASEAETPEDIVEYFLRCYDDYVGEFGIARDLRPTWLAGKTVLEYGPGDVPGVALLMIGHGAEKVYCADRFRMLTLSAKNVDSVERLLTASGPAQRERMRGCFDRHGDPASGWARERIEYIVEPRGLSQLEGVVDFAVSRAVLEHVNDLVATFEDVARALKPGGRSVHLVDLKSHGLHVNEPLDFLTWPEWLWKLMYSSKGVPNRLRPNSYREAIAGTSLRMRSIRPIAKLDHTEVARIRPRLARRFRSLSDEDLAWLGFWVALDKPA